MEMYMALIFTSPKAVSSLENTLSVQSLYWCVTAVLTTNVREVEHKIALTEPFISISAVPVPTVNSYAQFAISLTFAALSGIDEQHLLHSKL